MFKPSLLLSLFLAMMLAYSASAARKARDLQDLAQDIQDTVQEAVSSTMEEVGGAIADANEKCYAKAPEGVDQDSCGDVSLINDMCVACGKTWTV
jgi:hypothetical protein